MATRQPLRGRVVWTLPSYAGLLGAALGFVASLTPSLLPRALVFMILVTAVGTAAGYAAGTAVEWFARTAASLTAAYPTRTVTLVTLSVVWIPALVFAPLSIAWQQAQQQELNMPRALPGALTLIVVSLAIAVMLILVGRSIRSMVRGIASVITRVPPLMRWVNPHFERVRWVRATVSVVLIVLLFGAINGAFAYLMSSYDDTNASAEGQVKGDLGVSSGSPESLLSWETLGREGRYFVSNAMTPAEISAITDRPAEQPVRLYVGMQQADTFEARAALAVEELDRVDAWSREYVAIVGVTGTGWVDPDAVNSIETVTGGDVVTVATQYTAVPSWIGFVIDSQTTIDQNKATIDAVLARWRQLDENDRPELILFGESLGSMGTQGAWQAGDSPETVTKEIKRIIWIGPPAESTLWKSWQANRTAGPAWDPVIGDGSITRVLVETKDPGRYARETPPSIVFAAHANDPVVYWRPDLFIFQPSWTLPPLGPGVMPQLRWFPFITGFQVGMDLISGGAPPEVGHNYSADMAAAVAMGISDPVWTVRDTVELQKALPGLEYETG